MACILFVDDDPPMRNIFKRFLESYGYEVETASNGNEGLRKLSEVHCDLLITDVVMPEMDGFELIREVKKKYGGLPVIAISGSVRLASFNFLRLAKKLGACRTFLKPIDMDELLTTVKELLEEGYATASE